MHLSNTYWCIRHGHSLANAQELIVSSLERGVDPAWGLSPTGQQQADAAGVNLKTLLGDALNPEKLIVCTSPFSRCLETATRVGAVVGVASNSPRFRQISDLRERFFGEYELKSTDNYELVWADDAKSIENKPPGGGESVQDVSSRMLSVISALEEEFTGHSIVLVSHGDSLSILAASLLGPNLATHRKHGLPNCGILRIPKTP